MNDHSCVIAVPTSDKENVSKVLSAFWGDDPPGTDAFGVQLSADGNAPATHWLLHLYQNNAAALALAALPTGGGTLPSGVNLTPYSVSTLDAKAACANISRVSVKTGSVSPSSHVSDVLADLGLIQIEQ